MSDGAGAGLVERARSAAALGDWQLAFDLLTQADADGLLASTDLPVLGEVAYAAGYLDVTIETWERAHARACRPVTRSRPPEQPFASRCTCSSTPP